MYHQLHIYSEISASGKHLPEFDHYTTVHFEIYFKNKNCVFSSIQHARRGSLMFWALTLGSVVLARQ